MSYKDNDDDDDFQNPSEAIAISQSLILSSLRNPNHQPQPLKPSSGSLPLRKKQKRAVSTGKENRSSSRSDGVRVSEVRNKNKAARVENRDFSRVEETKLAEDSLNGDRVVECGVPSDYERKIEKDERGDFSAKATQNQPHLVEILGNEHDLVSNSIDGIQTPFVSTSYVPSSCNQMDDGFKEGISCRNSEVNIKRIEVSEVVSSLGFDSCVGDGCENLEVEPVKSSEIEEFGLKDLKGYDDSKCLETGRTSSYSMSIESRLLGSRVKSHSSSGGDCCEDFQLGTQLNVLMDLCAGLGEVSSSNDDFSCEESGSGKDGSIDCPLCGTDITHLSEELRQVHTNDCLDKGGPPEVINNIVDAVQCDLPQQVSGIDPVLEWLRKLGLSKYEEAFVREEVDWETLKWLTEEDLLNIGIAALGPRKKIVHALNELRQKNHSGEHTAMGIPNVTIENSKTLASANKLITQYFQGPTIQRNNSCSLSNSRCAIVKSRKDSVPKKVGPRSNIRKVRHITSWCCIPGTPFRVDAFRFLSGDCSHWFLTHFHMDHYQGLTKNFCHGKIYCSSVTAQLVNMKIGVPWERLHVLPLNQKVSVAGIKLTCLDANHCPGAIIILFEPPNGKAVLHTGDFRFSAEMASSSILQSCHVHTLILDTTYCNPQYDFPKQDVVIQFVIDAIQAEAFNPKTLFLIGTYTIGKERLFLEVARLLRKKVFVGAAKLRLLRCLGLPEKDMQWFTANEMESQIHVVPMWTVASFKRMKLISNQYSNRFNLIVAFSPTGWTFGKGKKKTPGRRWQQGTIIRYEVPYSEHSSFTELKEFVQFISPEHIIPSVNNEGPESADAMLALLMSDP